VNEEHPVRFSVDYPDRPLDRLTTAFRIFTVIPIAIVAGEHRRLHGSAGLRNGQGHQKEPQPRTTQPSSERRRARPRQLASPHPTTRIRVP